MKKIIYITIAFFAFGITSCNKQDIQPNANPTSQEPVWRSSTELDEGSNGGGSNEEGTEEGGIVDPDLDEDGK